MVKVEDYPSEDESSVMANYQGDRYMGPHEVMYLVIENLERVGLLGVKLPRSKLEHGMSEEYEKPPKVIL